MQNLRLLSAPIFFLGRVESSNSQVLLTTNFHQVPNVVPWIAIEVSKKIVHVTLFNVVCRVFHREDREGRSRFPS